MWENGIVSISLRYQTSEKNCKETNYSHNVENEQKNRLTTLWTVYAIAICVENENRNKAYDHDYFRR